MFMRSVATPLKTANLTFTALALITPHYGCRFGQRAFNVCNHGLPLPLPRQYLGPKLWLLSFESGSGSPNKLPM